jgi:hypothetical protein
MRVLLIERDLLFASRLAGAMGPGTKLQRIDFADLHPDLGTVDHVLVNCC